MGTEIGTQDAGANKERTTSPRRLLRAGKWIVRLLVILVVLIIMLAIWQRSLIYHPEKVQSIPARMQDRRFKVEDVSLESQDRLTLHGWHVPPLDTKRDETGVAVLYFPGNAGNRMDREVQLETLSRLGAHVFLFDYRGFGDNPGSPTEKDLASDAMSAWEVLRKQYPAGRIFIYGESLGGGVAVRLAAECCQKGDEPGGLIVQSSFSSLVDAGGYHFPWLPVSWLLIDRYPSIERIKHVTCPVLVMHGTQDSIVPFEMGRKLFEAAAERSKSGVAKQFIELQCDHNDVYAFSGAFTGQLKAFLEVGKTPRQIDLK